MEATSSTTPSHSGFSSMSLLYMAPMMFSLFRMVSQMWSDSRDQALQHCSTIVDTKEKSKCMLTFKINVLRQMISKLNQARSQCKGNSKCIVKVNEKIQENQEKLNALSQQLRDILNPPKTV